MNGLRALTSGSPVGQTVANAGATRDAAAVRVPAVTGPQPPMLDDDVIRPAAPTCPAGLIGGAAYAGASGPPLMIIEGLERIFRTGERPAVDGVTLDVYEGELLALLGPSGCGKTTTLRMIGGFEQPDAVPGFTVPVHRALTEPILLAGAPRAFAILNGTLAGAIGLGLQLWAAGIAIWMVGHLLAVWAARRDPLFVEVGRRHLRLPGHLDV